MNNLNTLAGRLLLSPTAQPPLRLERPVMATGVLDRLAASAAASEWPQQLARLLTLCGHAHQQAAAAALQLACPVALPARHTAHPDTAWELWQRLWWDGPRDCPVQAAPPDLSALKRLRAVQGAQAEALVAEWLGQDPVTWLQSWHADPAACLSDWCRTTDHALARWFRALEPEARALRVPSRPLPWPGDGVPTTQGDPSSAAWGDWCRALLAKPDAGQRPLWQGHPAETGPWTAPWQLHAVRHCGDVWVRLGARLAEAVRACAQPAHSASSASSAPCGAIALGPGQAAAWVWTSRGLLVHATTCDPLTGAIKAWRMVAPTEWNFHPGGELAQTLGHAAALGERSVRLLAVAFDPCLPFEITTSSPEACDA